MGRVESDLDRAYTSNHLLVIHTESPSDLTIFRLNSPQLIFHVKKKWQKQGEQKFPHQIAKFHMILFPLIKRVY